MVRIKKMRNKFLPSIVLVTAILVCFASVQSFFSKSTAQRLQFHKIVETDASGCVKVNFDQRPVSKALFGSATASMTAPHRTNAFMENEVMISLDLLSKKAIENLRGINFKSTEDLSKKAVEKLRGINLKSTEVLSKKAIEKLRGINLKSTEVFFTTCRDEMSREIAILFYAPLKRKLIFLVHPLIALFIVYFLSKFFAMLFVAAKGVGSTSVAVASDFSPSIADGQRKGSAKSMALRMKSEDASAVEAVATSLESKEETDRIAANEKVKKMAIEKALKEEEERERSASVQAKMEEQAARDIEENDRKVEAQRLAVEQATLRQLEEVRIERENKQRQEKELEARLADLQVKKEEQAIKAAQQKAAREEAAKVAELALQAKKEKQLKEQMEKKALEEEAAIVAAAALKEKREEQLKAQKKAKEVKEDEDRLDIVDKLAEIANKEREAEDARLKIIVEAKEKAAFDSIKMSEIEEVMAWEKAQKKAEGDAWASRPEQEKRILEEREAMREAEAMRPEGDSGAASKADSSIRDLDPGMPWKGFEKADADSQAALKAEEDLTEMALKFTAEMKEKEEVKEKEVNEAIERAKKIEDEETAKAMSAAKKATEIAEAARAEAQALQKTVSISVQMDAQKDANVPTQTDASVPVQKTVSIPVQMDAQKDANVPTQTDASVPVQKTVSIPVQMDAQKDANVKKSSFATKTADENSFMPPALFQKNKEAAQPAAGKKQPVVSKMKLITPPVTPSSSAGGFRKKEEPKVVETKVSSEEKVAVGAVDAVTASVDVNEENDRIAARELAVEKALKVYEEKEAVIAKKLEIEAKVAREAKEKLALEASNLAKLKEKEEAEAVTRAKENAAKKADLMAQIYAKEEQMSRALAMKLKDAMAKDASTRTEVKEMQV